MEPVTYTASTSVQASTSIQIPSVGYDFLTPIVNWFGGVGSNSAFTGYSFLDGLIDSLSGVWSVYAAIAYIVSILFMVLYVYASVHKNLYLDLITQQVRDMENLYNDQFSDSPRNSRLDDVIEHSSSDNPNDWRLAIIEADIILDELLKERGFAGATLGERLKSISPQQLSSIQDAWEAHKVRNKIAHSGTDFVLTKRMAQETIGRYRLVFNEFELK